MNQRQRAFAGHSFDTANACGSAGFRNNAEQADIAGARRVDTAAQFGGEIAHAQYTHAVFIFLAEQRHRAFGFRRFQIHDISFNRQVATDLRVHQIFNFADLFRLHGFEMREVETQAFIVNQRAFLRDMGAKHLAQRGVHQVRRRVVETNTLTARLVHFRFNALAHFQNAAGQLANMPDRLTIFLGVVNGESETIAFQLAFIAHLAARLRIEWRFIQHHNGLLARRDLLNGFTIDKQRGDPGGQFGLIVAFEF
ncbi:L-carnitine dehydratase/bile acid-inducible protein F(EC:2.8.3.16) [Cronobacter turicensis 564]|nr:L-carnitine dehydratase/bile acid-inducible protein F(EC:2.8.3.16) [Cronobacter turicensis 564]